MAEIILIITISIIISISPFIAKITKIPTTPVEIVLGSLSAYMGFLYHFELFELIAEFGFLYLMFLAGTEVNMSKILKADSRIIKRALLYLAILYTLSALFAFNFNFSKIFILIMPLISIGLVASLAKDYGSNSDWIYLSFIVGSLGEVVSIGILTVASEAFKVGIVWELYSTIAYLILFIGAMVLLFKLLQTLFWWYPELRTLLMPHLDNQEQSIRLSMAILFIMLSIMLFLDLELAFGAFIAGIFIPSFFGHKSELPERLSGYGFGFLVPIFFVYVGSTFQLSALLIDGLVAKAVLITFLMIIMRLVASFVFYSSHGVKNSVLLALSHSMPLTLLIAVSTLAYHANSIDKFHYYTFILASLFEVIVAMLLIKIIHLKPELLEPKKD